MTNYPAICVSCGADLVFDSLGYGSCPTCVSQTITVKPEEKNPVIGVYLDDYITNQEYIAKLQKENDALKKYTCPRCNLDLEDGVQIWGAKLDGVIL